MPYYLDGADRAALNVLSRGLVPFRDVHNALPLQYAQTLVAVMVEENMTTNEIAEATGIAPHTISRQLADCGRINRYHRPRYGLLQTLEDISDRRFHRTSLTPLGQALAGRVLKAMAA
jgi:DNA-binding MarR family transcriptional regulator